MPGDNWTANWCAPRLKHESILGANALSDNLIELQLKDEGNIKIATMSLPAVSLVDIPDTARSPEIQFLVNINNDALYHQDIINFAANANFGLGSIGDFYRAINEKNLRAYIAPENAFILRALSQHNAVSGVELLNNRTYVIHRHNLDDYRVLALNDYEMTAVVIRAGFQKYGHSRTVLASNPNARITPEAKEAARAANARIVTFGQLLGAINY